MSQHPPVPKPQPQREPPRKSTNTYRQPEEYHFCQDSVLLPLFVAEQIREDEISSEYRALDVCAGCGVVGLELAHYEPRIRKFDFLELQAIFKQSCEANIKGREGFRFVQQSYVTLDRTEYLNTYDLIVCNPPYFMPGEGRLSPSAVQNQCRFFLNDGLRELVEGVVNALKPNGRAFLLMKSGVRHGRKAERDLKLWVAGRAEIEISTIIRGTAVIQLRRIATAADLG